MQLPFWCAVAMGGGELRIFLLYHLDLDSSQYFIINITFRRDFPEGTVFKTLCFQCRGCRLLCSTAKKIKIFSRECVLPYTSFSEVFFLSLDFYISTQILDWIHQVLKKNVEICVELLSFLFCLLVGLYFSFSWLWGIIWKKLEIIWGQSIIIFHLLWFRTDL